MLRSTRIGNAAATPLVAIPFQEISKRLVQPGSGMSGWSVKGAAATPEAGRTQDSISKTFRFKDFHGAWSFMSRCVPYINEADHHPEWFNVYNRVEVTLTTHDAKGVTDKDFGLAMFMQSIEEEELKKQ